MPDLDTFKADEAMLKEIHEKIISLFLNLSFLKMKQSILN